MNQCNEPDHGAINAERAESRGLRKAWVELDDKRQDLEKQLSAITEQRDRLAEALLWAKKEHDARIAVFAYAGPVISAEYERLGMRLMEAKHNATIARESALAIVKETKKQQKKTTH
jgi:hypothetical protein